MSCQNVAFFSRQEIRPRAPVASLVVGGGVRVLLVGALTCPLSSTLKVADSSEGGILFCSY